MGGPLWLTFCGSHLDDRRSRLRSDRLGAVLSATQIGVALINPLGDAVPGETFVNPKPSCASHFFSHIVIVKMPQNALSQRLRLILADQEPGLPVSDRLGDRSRTGGDYLERQQPWLRPGSPKPSSQISANANTSTS
jgi:hypothetical protein